MQRIFCFVCFLLFSIPIFLTPVDAGQHKIYVVNGEITAADYAGFEQFLFNSLDTVIGLKINFGSNSDYQIGKLSAEAQNGQFVAYIAGTTSKSEIVATEGFQYLHGDYVFDGFFVVKSGGMHQGVISLYLQRTDEAQVRLSNAKLMEIRSYKLKSKYLK